MGQRATRTRCGHSLGEVADSHVEESDRRGDPKDQGPPDPVAAKPGRNRFLLDRHFGKRVRHGSRSAPPGTVTAIDTTILRRWWQDTLLSARTGNARTDTRSRPWPHRAGRGRFLFPAGPEARLPRRPPRTRREDRASLPLYDGRPGRPTPCRAPAARLGFSNPRSPRVPSRLRHPAPLDSFLAPTFFPPFAPPSGRARPECATGGRTSCMVGAPSSPLKSGVTGNNRFQNPGVCWIRQGFCMVRSHESVRFVPYPSAGTGAGAL